MKNKLVKIGFFVFLFVIGFLVGGGIAKSFSPDATKNTHFTKQN
jgi:hypothetical protein